MQKILGKRVLRDLKSNCFRYLALGLMIVIGMYLVVSLVGAADTVITDVDLISQKNHLEDGEFSVFIPLTEEQEEKLKDKGITLEKMFYLDYAMKGDSSIRVFKNRKEVNLITIDKGRLPEKPNEAVIERRYSEVNKLSMGDSILIDGHKLKIVGIGTVPDYDAMLKNMSDASVDSNHFGLAFVTDEEYKNFKEKGNYTKTEEYVYSYKLNGKMTYNELKNYLCKPDFKTGMNNLTQLVTAEDNPRIKASSGDQVINKFAGLVSGIIVMILFTYVISVFVIHGVERESSVIGALHALGVKKKELIIHYLMLPVLITLIAGILGTVIGFSKYGVNVQMQNCYTYYSVPELKVIYPAYLVIYGVIMPPAVAALVNYFVISSKLSQPALKMLRNEQKSSRISNINLGNMGFVRRFRIRQMLREARTGFTVIFGMFISLLIMMLGIDCYVMSHNMSVDNKADTKYEYMYTYKYPQELAPEGGEACYAETLSKEAYGYNLDVTLLGIGDSNPYFNVNTVKGKNEVVIASSTAEKFNLKKGDKLILEDRVENKDYTFTVEDIAPYSVGLNVFMNINNMRELFGQKKDYYNVVFSSKKLNIDAGRLYAVTTKKDISKSSDVFIDKMMPMIVMLIVISAVIFCVVMYLMMKVMIDRASYSISLIKIFGYRTGEIRKLYLDGNLYIISAGAAICIPAAKKLMDYIYPYLISNVACGMNLAFSWQLYLGIYGGIILLYLVINQALVGRLKKIIPAEVLKNRE